MKIRRVGDELFNADRRTDGQRDMTKLVGFFFFCLINFAALVAWYTSQCDPRWLKCWPAPLQTAAGLRWYMNMGHWWNYVCQEKPEEVEEQLVPVSPSPPQLSHGKYWNRNKASAMRRQRITASPTYRGNDCRQRSFVFSAWDLTWVYQLTEFAVTVRQLLCLECNADTLAEIDRRQRAQRFNSPTNCTSSVIKIY